MNEKLIIPTILILTVSLLIPAVIYIVEQDKKLFFITFSILGVFSALFLISIKTKMIYIDDTNSINFQFPVVSNDTISQKPIIWEQTENPMPKPDTDTGIIFFGDSRTNGMAQACDITQKPNQFVVAKDGAGYTWASSEGLDTVNSIIEQASFPKWMVICLFGVNDPGNAENYLELYNKLNESCQLVIISVNPITKSPFVTDQMIQNCNSVFKNSGLQYIDTYDILKDNMFETTDGIHYTTGTYRMIYNHISNILHIPGNGKTIQNQQ